MKTTSRAKKTNITFDNLRLVPAKLLRAYLRKCARHHDHRFTKPWVMSHSWLPGFVQLTHKQAGVVAALQRRGASDLEPPSPDLVEAIVDLGWCAPRELDLAALCRKTDLYMAFQNRWELGKFLGLARARRPRVVVEIGTAAGGMLYCLAQVAHPEALIVSIDWPETPYAGGQVGHDAQLFAHFGGPAQRIACLRMRSGYYDTRERLKQLLGGRAIDLLFIDGDHSYGAVRADFEMYQPLVAKDGLIALHDINCLPERGWGPGFDVGFYWEELRATHETIEFSDPRAAKRPRVGEEWPAYGIGVVLGPRRAGARRQR